MLLRFNRTTYCCLLLTACCLLFNRTTYCCLLLTCLLLSLIGLLTAAYCLLLTAFFNRTTYCCLLLTACFSKKNIETNPGPERTNFQFICHWNLNSECVDDFTKLAQIEVYLSLYKFLYTFVHVLYTFLDSSISDDDPRIALNGYNLLRCDHPSNSKKGGVCIYFKDHLPLTKKSGITRLSECLVYSIDSVQKYLTTKSYLIFLFQLPIPS